MEADLEHASLGGIEGPCCPLGEAVGEAGCPGCGLTRSTALVMQGDYGSAFSVHPTGFVVVVLCAFGFGLCVLRLRRGTDPRWWPAWRRWGQRAFLAGLGAGWACKLLCSVS